MNLFPCFRYHATLAREGKLFRSEADLPPAGEGWVDTPAAFEAGYVAPPPQDEAPTGLAAAARALRRPAKPYPAHRYKRDDADHPVIVKDADEDAKLDPAVWKDTPDPNAWDNPAPAMRPMASDGVDQPPSAPPEPVEIPQDIREEIYAAKLGDLIGRIETMTSTPKLEALARAEEDNPSKRATILKAIKARLKVLAASPE